ncbi:hypothetical protein, partial [Salmonella enterica]|uniref:hypothetical protein n=1 Tax=Salmonella enterica TaxID=28901 RepID=UPI0039E73954
REIGSLLFTVFGSFVGINVNIDSPPCIAIEGVKAEYFFNDPPPETSKTCDHRPVLPAPQSAYVLEVESFSLRHPAGPAS